MSDMHPAFSDFARGVTTETAFDVLVIAKQLKAEGKKVVELERTTQQNLSLEYRYQAKLQLAKFPE